jgi:cell division protein FtsW
MKLAVTVLVFCVAALLSLGMVMLYSASMSNVSGPLHDHLVGAHLLVMQSIWCALGLVICVAVAASDYRWLKKLAWPMLLISVVLLGLVLEKHFGVVRGRARRWFSFGPISLQPSEFAKITLIIALAWYGEHFQRRMPTFKRGILIPGLFIAPVIGLIFIEPDVGNAMLLAAVVCCMLLIAGIKVRYFLPPLMIGLVALGIFLYNNPMRSQRIYSWTHLEETKQDKGRQQYQAMLAFGAGGMTGLGLGNGRQKLGFVPEHHTDFILSIIGEELGLIATLLVVTAFVVLLICGLIIASRACDTFGMLLASGITLLIGLQAAINIGVVTAALPNKGLPLPFISYGGSNLLAMLICIGLLLSVARFTRVEDLADEPVGEAQTA